MRAIAAPGQPQSGMQSINLEEPAKPTSGERRNKKQETAWQFSVNKRKTNLNILTIKKAFCILIYVFASSCTILWYDVSETWGIILATSFQA